MAQRKPFLTMAEYHALSGKPVWRLKVIGPDETREFPKVSADAAKREAKDLKQYWPGAKFEIYDPQGSLYQFSVGSTGRMKWVWGK